MPMPKPDIRLVALDLDGTLLTSAQQLPSLGASLLTALAQRGIHVVLATTRRYASTAPFYHALQLTTPLICGNGAQVWASADGPLWAEHCIDQAAARAIAELADAQGWELGISYADMTYLRQRPHQPLGLLSPGLTVAACNCDGVVGAPLRILAWHPDAINALTAFSRTHLAAHCVAEVYVNADDVPESLGIFAPHANKGTALQLVMARLGVTREQVVTMGDNYNDLSMFACGDVSVAMGNAPQAVRQRATIVAPSHDDEGVAWALRELALA